MTNEQLLAYGITYEELVLAAGVTDEEFWEVYG